MYLKIIKYQKMHQYLQKIVQNFGNANWSWTSYNSNITIENGGYRHGY